MLDATSVFNREMLNITYVWLCKQRAYFPPNADIWHLRYNRGRIASPLLASLRAEQYRFSPMENATKGDGTTVHLRSAQAALVLKILAKGIAPPTGYR